MNRVELPTKLVLQCYLVFPTQNFKDWQIRLILKLQNFYLSMATLEERSSLFHKASTYYFLNEHFFIKLQKLTPQSFPISLCWSLSLSLNKLQKKSTFYERCTQHLIRNKWNLKKQICNNKVNYQALKIGISPTSSFFLASQFLKDYLTYDSII